MRVPHDFTSGNDERAGHAKAGFAVTLRHQAGKVKKPITIGGNERHCRRWPGGRRMKIFVDTNVLVRAVLQEHAKQGRAAGKLLKQAALIAVSLPCLCELVWILRRGAKLSKKEVAVALRDLLDVGNNIPTHICGSRAN